MSDNIVVMFKEEGGNRRETRWFNQTRDAEHFIEGLLEAGFERQNIRVLEGREMDVLVTQKPVVSLLPQVNVAMPAQKRTEALLTSAPGPESDPVLAVADVSREPYTQDGVRFSSRFGPESLGQRARLNIRAVPAKP